MSPRAVLVGLPGAGKTTTGRRLANRLGVPFADSDMLIESSDGRSVPAIFEADGEERFREIEAITIAGALADFDGVLALGGGAVLTDSTRAALAACGVPVILLRSSVRTLSRRVGDGRGRPLLNGAKNAGALSSKLGRLASAREPLYREVATHVISTDRRSSAKVATEIAELLGTTP
jgi:shikimate kinase